MLRSRLKPGFSLTRKQEHARRSTGSREPSHRRRPREAYLSVTRGWVSNLARWLRVAVEVHRDARRAEAMYHELSSLCDAQLKRRGMTRQQSLKHVFGYLTGL